MVGGRRPAGRAEARLDRQRGPARNSRVRSRATIAFRFALQRGVQVFAFRRGGRLSRVRRDRIIFPSQPQIAHRHELDGGLGALAGAAVRAFALASRRRFARACAHSGEQVRAPKWRTGSRRSWRAAVASSQEHRHSEQRHPSGPGSTARSYRTLPPRNGRRRSRAITCSRFRWHSGLHVVREIRKTSASPRRRRRWIIVSVSQPQTAQRHSSPRGGVSARRARLVSSRRRWSRRAAHSGEHVTAARRSVPRPRRSRSFSVAPRERPHSEQYQDVEVRLIEMRMLRRVRAALSAHEGRRPAPRSRRVRKAGAI
jgi:hypothetical protein